MMGDTNLKMRNKVSFIFSIHIMRVMRDIVFFMFFLLLQKSRTHPLGKYGELNIFSAVRSETIVPAYVIIIAYFGMFVKIFSRPLSAPIW